MKKSVYWCDNCKIYFSVRGENGKKFPICPQCDSNYNVVFERVEKLIKYALVNVNLKYELPDDVYTKDDIIKFIENVDLPEEYVEGSFKLVEVVF